MTRTAMNRARRETTRRNARWSGLLPARARRHGARLGATLAAALAAALLQPLVPPAPLAAQGAAGGEVRTATPSGPERIEVRVDGMTCPFCAFGLEKRLRKVEGLDSLRIDVDKGAAILHVADGARVSDERIHRLVKEAGFTVGAIERRPLPAGWREP